MKKLRIASLILLVIAAIVSTDLLIHLLGNLIPVMNDGLGAHTALLPAGWFFGDTLWSLERFYNTYVISALVALALFLENVVLAIIAIVKK